MTTETHKGKHSDHPLIAAELVDAYQRDGAVMLPGVFADWVERLREAVAANMADPSPFQRSYVPADGSAPFFQDYCNWQRFELMQGFVHHSPAAPIAAALMRSSSARFFHDHVLVKEPGTSIVTPWHQDQPYYCVDGEQSVSFWVPLDPVGRDTVMECVAGSHRWGKDFKPMRFNGQPLYRDDDFERMPDIEALRDQLSIVGWEMAPGDAIAFNFRTIHGAPANRSQTRRRVFSTRWVGDDACFAVREGTTSPPFPGLELADGAPLDAPIFPVIFRQ
jgi:ectoine hydroxylase-related dioxygenase (phytanoyl-CoA dioxygenase family)